MAAARPSCPPENATRSTNELSDAAAMAVSGVRARTSDAAARDASSASRGALDAAPRGNAASAAAANRASFDAFDGTGTSRRRRSSEPSSDRDPNGRASEERASRRGGRALTIGVTCGVTRADASRRAATRSASRANVAPASGGGASRPLFDKRSADRSRAVSRAMRSSARRTNPRAPRNRAATGSMSSVSRYRSALGASAPNAESAEVSSRGGRSRESSSPKTPEEKARSPSSSRLVASRLSRRSKKAREELCPPCSPRASSVSNARTSAPSAAKRARAESAASRRSRSAASERRLADPRASASRAAHAPAPRIAARSSSRSDPPFSSRLFLRASARSRQRRARRSVEAFLFALAAVTHVASSVEDSENDAPSQTKKEKGAHTGARVASVARASASLRSGGASDASRNWRTAGRSRVSHSVTSSSPPASTASRASSNTRARSVRDAFRPRGSGTSSATRDARAPARETSAAAAAAARRVVTRHASPSAARASG